MWTRRSTFNSSVATVIVVSKCTVHPDTKATLEEFKLFVSDLPKLSCHYIQASSSPGPQSPLLSLLKSSLSRALAGRLSTLPNGCIIISYNDTGADFSHAIAPSLTLPLPISSDVSLLIKSLFPFNDTVSYQDHFWALAASRSLSPAIAPSSLAASSMGPSFAAKAPPSRRNFFNNSTFPRYPYENNSGLCGFPLPSCEESADDKLNNQHRKSYRRQVSLAGSVAMGLIFSHGTRKEYLHDDHHDDLAHAVGSWWTAFAGGHDLEVGRQGGGDDSRGGRDESRRGSVGGGAGRFADGGEELDRGGGKEMGMEGGGEGRWNSEDCKGGGGGRGEERREERLERRNSMEEGEGERHRGLQRGRGKVEERGNGGGRGEVVGMDWVDEDGRERKRSCLRGRRSFNPCPFYRGTIWIIFKERGSWVSTNLNGYLMD